MSEAAEIAAESPSFWRRVTNALVDLNPLVAVQMREQLEPEPVDEQRQEPVFEAPAAAPARWLKEIARRVSGPMALDLDVADAWSRCARRHVSVSAIQFGIDDFRQPLSAVARSGAEEQFTALEDAVRHAVPEAMFSARLGEAGLLVVLPDCPTLLARKMALGICEVIAARVVEAEIEGRRPTTVSAGVATANPSDRRFVELREAAAEALERAQVRGASQIAATDLRAMAQTVKRLAG